MYKEIEGDLIKLALAGEFDVISHGVNCFCIMGGGIAPQMHKKFLCNSPEWYTLEHKSYQGDINKLGQIEWRDFFLFKNIHGVVVPYNHDVSIIENYKNPKVFAEPGTSIVKEVLTVVNSYTQYDLGRNHKDGKLAPIDYQALTLCMRKINHIFKGKHIGLPQIGAGLGGGNWGLIKSIIQQELDQCEVTVVIYKP